MFALWLALMLLMAAHLAALPFWIKIFRKVNFLIFIGAYPAIFFALLVPIVLVSLKISRRSQEEDRPKIEQLSSLNYDGLRDVRGQIHVHSYLSHDSRGTLEEITQAAKTNGVRWIILTDHIGKLPPGDYPDKLNGVSLIYGCERNYRESTSVFRASLKDSSEKLFLHGHIESFSGGADSKWLYQKRDEEPEIHWDALEIVNFHANALDNKFGILASVFFNPYSLYDNITGLIPENFTYWQKLAERECRPIPIFGAPDAHQNIRILGQQVDPYELTLGLISTHIWLEEDKDWDQESIFAAIKKGRTYVAFDHLGDPSGFRFHAETMKGKCMTGESIEKPKYLSVSAPGPDAACKIRYYRDNVLIGNFDGCFGYMPDPEPGFWRVEVWRDEKPWIISGQILVK